MTHRYDALKCEPEELWIMGVSDEDADKAGVFFSGSHYSLADDSREWLKTVSGNCLKMLKQKKR